MTVLEKIIDLLTNSNIVFERLDHLPVHTSQEAAAIRGSSLDMGAKALVCYVDKNPVLIVVPGDMKLDFKQFKLVIGVKDIRMASPDEVFTLTGLRIGCIPPTGSVLGLPSYLDIRIGTKSKIVFNAGNHAVSIFMSPSDLIAIEKPTTGDFAVPLVNA